MPNYVSVIQFYSILAVMPLARDRHISLCLKLCTITFFSNTYIRGPGKIPEANLFFIAGIIYLVNF